jgi:hypothetical protein
LGSFSKERAIMIHQVSADSVRNKKKTVFLEGKYNVIFKMPNNYFFEGEFICEMVSIGFCYPTSQLTLTLGKKIFKKTASDYFEALCRIRQELEKQDIYPCCLGACKNVYPSGFSRGMGNGLNAYQLEFGKQAKTLVHIFSYDQNVEPVTVAEQKKFYEDYCNSFSW